MCVRGVPDELYQLLNHARGQSGTPRHCFPGRVDGVTKSNCKRSAARTSIMARPAASRLSPISVKPSTSPDPTRPLRRSGEPQRVLGRGVPRQRGSAGHTGSSVLMRPKAPNEPNICIHNLPIVWCPARRLWLQRRFALRLGQPSKFRRLDTIGTRRSDTPMQVSTYGEFLRKGTLFHFLSQLLCNF